MRCLTSLEHRSRVGHLFVGSFLPQLRVLVASIRCAHVFARRFQMGLCCVDPRLNGPRAGVGGSDPGVGIGNSRVGVRCPQVCEPVSLGDSGNRVSRG